MSALEKITTSPAYKPLMRKALYLALLACLTGLGLFFFYGDTNILIYGFAMLALLFFIKAYEPQNPQEEERVETPTLLTSKGFATFVHKIFWWGCTTLTVAALFTLCRWARYEVLLVVGVITFIAGLVMKLLIRNAHQQR